MGCAHCGAIEALCELGHMSHIVNFAGASAGAIIAGGLACQASAAYLTKAMTSVDFLSILNLGNPIRAAYNFVRYKGLARGDSFEEWYGDRIEELTGDRGITLKQIHDRYGGRLVIAVTNIDTRKLVLADFRLKPNWSLVRTVHASMAVPGIFAPVEIDGDLYVDGGELDNMPWQAFHRDTTGDDRINPLTLGLMLASGSDINEKYPRVTSMVTYIEALYGCTMNQTQKLYMDAQDWARAIKIPCVGPGIFSMNFALSDAQKTSLVEMGREAVIKHFSGTTDPNLATQEIMMKSTMPESGWDSDDEKTPNASPINRLKDRALHPIKPVPSTRDVDPADDVITWPDESVFVQHRHPRRQTGSISLPTTMPSSKPRKIPQQLQFDMEGED